MKQATLKINIQIHKVRLQVRFPCSVSATLKIQNEEISFGQDIPLRLGQAVFELAASHQVTLYYDSVRNVFEEKKISLLLFLKSSSGRINAGSVSISINSIGKGQSRLAIPIEKCPDKHAITDLSISFDCLNEVECQYVDINKKSSLRNSLVEEKTPKGILKKSVMDVSRHTDKENPSSSLTNSKVLQKSSMDKSRHELDRSKHEMKHSPTKKGQLEEEAEHYNTSPSGFNHIVDYNAKSKATQLQRELKNLQKRFEQQTLQLKSSISKKEVLEKSMKESEDQLKALREKYQDILTEYENVLKKTQFKDGSLKDQLKTLTDKLAASESEKQKMIFAKNDLVNEFEEREKSLRLGLREKQKLLSDEKIKISKKLEQTISQFNQLKSHCVEVEGKEREASKELAQERIKGEQFENVKSELLHQVSFLKSQLSEQKKQRKQLEETLGSNTELEEQKKKFRKKIGELQQEISKQLTINASAQLNSQKHLRRSEELDEIVKEKVSNLKNLQKESEALNKNIQTLKNGIAEKERKIQELSKQKQKQVEKMEGIIKEISQSNKRLQEEKKGNLRDLKEKDNLIRSLKEQLESDDNDINDINQRNGELEMQLLEHKSTCTKLEHQYEDLMNANANLEGEKNDLQEQVNAYVQSLDKLEKEHKVIMGVWEEAKRQLETNIRNLQYRIENSSEQNSFRIRQLERKLNEVTKEHALKCQEFEKLQTYVENVQGDKMKGLASNEELEYNLKLKVNEVIFLNESLQKVNEEINKSIAQNKELSIEIEALRKNIVDLNEELESVSKQLSNASQGGEGIKQEFIKYKAKNIDDITQFLKTVQGGIINALSQHIEPTIAQAMREAADRNNQYVANTEIHIKELQIGVASFQDENDNLKIEVQAKANEIESLSASLNEEITRGKKLGQNSESFVKQLQDEIGELKTNQQLLREELKQLELVHGNIVQELQQASVQLEERSSKCNQLDNSLREITKQLKDITTKSESEKKALSNKVGHLEEELEKKVKEIEAKGATIVKYGDIEKKLRNDLQESNKQIQALKEVSQNIRKRNEKGTVRQKELEEELSKVKDNYSALSKKENELQKQLKENLTEHKTLKDTFSKLQSYHQAVEAELEETKGMLSMKENHLKTMTNESALNQKESQTVGERLNGKIKQLEGQLESEKKTSSKEIQRLTKQSQELNQAKLELQQNIVNLNKAMDQKEKTQNLQGLYLKPIRNDISFLKAHMAQYSRVGDQFESNKNKLLKMTGSKLEQYTDRTVVDKLRDVSLVFQKLKAFLLTGAVLNEKQKENVSEEMKKVQFSLDRALRGDR